MKKFSTPSPPLSALSRKLVEKVVEKQLVCAPSSGYTQKNKAIPMTTIMPFLRGGFSYVHA
jgi:hypothetical protein